ncbi:MAG: hypothetical protein GF331_23885 [Chitinivibrionales bacterium]|nr:hypothetical protein [Chitinivibrionales bacterium]
MNSASRCPAAPRLYAAAVLAAMALWGCRHLADTQGSGRGSGSLDELTSEICARISAVASEGRPVRVAVVAFAPTQSEFAERNEFGVYFAERVTSELKKNRNQIRLFERSRLEVILRENALTLSGLVNAETAARIGELAPVDYILTGSYTRLSGAVSINARLLDVVSGEIVFTSAAELVLTSDLAGLLAPASGPAASAEGAVEKLDPCAGTDARIMELLVDLSSPDNVRRLVNEAIATPFDTGCGDIHFKILSRFSRHRIADDKYTEFLVATLAGIDAPLADARAQEILRYVHRLGPLSDREWEAGLAVARKIGNDYLNVYLSYLFHTRDVDDALVRKQYARVDRVLELARAGKIGLPVPLGFATVFRELVGGLGPFHDDTDKRLIVHAYEKYGQNVFDEPPRRHLKILRAVFRTETDAERRQKVFGWICELYNRQEPSPELASTLFGEMTALHRRADDSTLSGAERELSAELYSLFMDKCGNQIEQTLGLLTSESRRKEAAVFCFVNDIDVPELSLSVDSLVRVLDSDDTRGRRDAAEMLTAMGTAAGAAEPTVLKLLRRGDRLRGQGVTNLLWSLVAILGNIRTSNPEAHELLMHYLESRNYAVADSVQAAFVRIGGPIVPVLKREFPTREPKVQILIVEVFGMMGAAARAELPYLRGLMKQTENAYVRDAVNEAIDRIERARG